MDLLRGQVAVVTGASSGIGRATALGLAASGAVVCLVGRDAQKLETVARDASSHGGQVRCYHIDLTQASEIQALASALQRDLKEVHVLVHSAGMISLGKVEAASVQDFDRQYEVNVRGPYLLTQALLPLLQSCRGQVVFMNSSAALNAGANVGQYAATKAALKAMADSLREEVNPQKIRVLSVFIGRTATPMQAQVHHFEAKPYRPELLMQPEDVAAIVLHALALPRSCEVTQINIRPMVKT